MNTAIKIDHTYPVLQVVPFEKMEVARNEHPLLTASEEIFDVMGWSNLPNDLKLTIALDLIGFSDELKGLYSTKSNFVYNRRKRIYHWVRSFQDGLCDLETAIDALKLTYLD